MTSSDPSSASSSRDGVVPRAPYVGLDPEPLRHGPNAGSDLRSQLLKKRADGRRFIAFVSILLGDDEVLDEGVPGNKRVEERGILSGRDHDTMHPHGGELAYSTTTTLWLPENLKNGAATLGYNNDDEFLEHMRILCVEVLNFRPRATHVAKAFARMDFYLLQPVLFKFGGLQMALKALVKGMGTKLPLMDPLLPNIVPSVGCVPTASYILEPQPPRVGSDADDLSLHFRARFYDTKQFYIFLSILLGEDQPPDEDATVHNSGGSLSVTDHDSLQPHGASSSTVWLPQYLKKRDAILGYHVSQCWDQLMELFSEVMKFGARATNVAKEFARMKIEHVEFLLEHPEVRRSFLQRLDRIAGVQDTGELMKIFMSEVETGIPLDALPEKLLPDVEPIDDDYIKLSVIRYFG